MGDRSWRWNVKRGRYEEVRLRPFPFTLVGVLILAAIILLTEGVRCIS